MILFYCTPFVVQTVDKIGCKSKVAGIAPHNSGLTRLNHYTGFSDVCALFSSQHLLYSRKPIIHLFRIQEYFLLLFQTNRF